MGAILTVDFKLPVPRRIMSRYLPQPADVLSYSLVFRSGFVFIDPRTSDVICEKATARGFQEIPFAKRAARNAYVEWTGLSATKLSNDFIARRSKAQAARQIVSSAERQNAQRNTIVHEAPRNFCNCSISACC